MSLKENELLLEKIRSSDFTALDCIDNLRGYRESIGIQHTLVQKLRSYSYDELEFYIPQFVQLLVAFETDSMALEEFLLEYCSKYPHYSMVVFWNLQSCVFELRNDPESYSFQVVRNFINKLQNILFNNEELMKKPEFRENFQPAIILCGVIASAIGAPRFNDYASSLVRSQAKQQKSFVFKLANFQKTLTKNLTMKNKRLSSETATETMSDDEARKVGGKLSHGHQRSASVPRMQPKKNSLTISSDESEYYTSDEESEFRSSTHIENEMSKLGMRSENRHRSYIEVEENLKINTVITPKRKNRARQLTLDSLSTKYEGTDAYVSHSLPDLSRVHEADSQPYLSPAESESSLNFPHSSIEQGLKRNLSLHSTVQTPSYNQLLKVLQINYAKKETEFIMALQNISLRLSSVPKEARLSALRAELSIINETLLPSEIDIPQLLPITSSKNKRYHKILKLSINEACVLNSAERVPFLLLVEYLSDEFDFNPFTDANQKIIANRNNHEETSKSSHDLLNEMIEGSQSGLKSPVSVRASTENTEDSLVYVEEEETDLGELPMLTVKSDRSFVIQSDIERSPKTEQDKKLSSFPSNTNADTTKLLADQMRIASVMLQQLESSGQASSEQSSAIKSRIVESMISLQDQFDTINYERLNLLKGDLPDAGERKLENDFKLGEDWNTKKERIRKSSVYGHLDNWELCSVIAKNGDDLPQEAFACQLISLITSIWKRQGVKDAWTKRMKILITSANTGLVETINNAMSIHSIKKSMTEISINDGENTKGRIFTLQDYFENMFGSPTSQKYKRAQNNFARSLASYSIICYVLQIKDRHNGNIMLDNDGHIIHIDFGFLLSNSPGSVGFEAAPFKLTSEYVNLLGGNESAPYLSFVDMCKKCFNALRKEHRQIVNLVELMQKDSTLPCFKNGENTSVLLEQRLQLQLSEEESEAFVENTLIGRSYGSMYTRLYDQFQMITQGIYS
ncbi:Phosphatidylinositol 4-kinase PIK1alpha (PI4-kinase)(PtdIns-4-kinase) [Scheffersomyces stipitis CBS 6054]|uniref:1-phosphatidylinositol 4-kinase n=1 Tax=Scheffersomyces stipitis (strain ATCC 58785 / CBS 6054 / NBRC 10063 / NRRL Y-11545) TaxID=322104 RepID=A3LZ98_PICST|nr:Phosphatidylinositol 4-kinase PIK1alpha (PI4-kinase)(PtdIns-4-kinase) [Scheffersomyces stipitis CBS 6054]ABN68301.2 Phosphatidylinositol 4-kinase PIK1alpha (PI4-kinase)(PtdIns-4-kinase) [Scheffersomyces stipitis CBS 6054]KAG2734615.1 hypothetical protein G9P44_002621 [Scheffersomyces stipitis]